MSSFALIVPTLNPGPRWPAFLDALNSQIAKPSRVLVIDSSSDDGSVKPSEDSCYELITIPRAKFNHGFTRQSAFEQLRAQVDAVVFMTQDAILADEYALSRLITALDKPNIAATYGRQLPLPEATPFARHARQFNYGPDSAVKQMSDRHRLGIKTCFLSNSFAAYRCRDLDEIGGFPATDFGEDMLVAGLLLEQGKKISYVSDARVYHSHNYSVGEEFRRYRMTGRFHARHPWLMREFGATTREGQQFVRSEVRYIFGHAPWLLPAVPIRTLAKYSGYLIGKYWDFTGNLY